MLLKSFTLLLLFYYALSCPREDELHPCTCEDSSDDSKNINCPNIDNDQDLLNAANALRGVKNIYSFTIENAILQYIPHDLFNGIELQELEFLSSSIMAFSDTDVAFKGLEDTLDILLITDCSYMNSWDWSLLRSMKKLIRVDIIKGDMVSIEDNVREINHLNLIDISFSQNQISYIYDYAFSNFTELMSLTLNNNLIKEVKRSMLPNPAEKLRLIDLGYNEIEQLPEDFFQNMPSLELITIISNKILTLKQQVFEPVWEQLEAFQAMNNKLRCDCRLAWILEKKRPQNVRAVCEQPSSLRGKNIMDLSRKDMWC